MCFNRTSQPVDRVESRGEYKAGSEQKSPATGHEDPVMIQRIRPSARRLALSVAAPILALSLLSGCGLGTPSVGVTNALVQQGTGMTGKLHGDPSPIVGAAVTLYTTSSGYGATATVVATTTTLSDGSFGLTLPTATIACPSGEYAYIGAYGGNTGAGQANSASLIMIPVGLCDTYYTHTGTAGNYVNTYTGGYVWGNEMTSAVSAYALGNFMTVTNTGVINIGSTPNNHGTASATTPSAAGLGHAFQNALNLVNTHNGQTFANLGGAASTSAGIIPASEISLLGNILQACVNSTGPTAASTATSNDGTACGELFSFTTPPQAGAASPTNTMQAMLNLAHDPNPSVNTWNPTCTAAGAGTTTATACLFNLASGASFFPNPLTAAPPDWSLAVVFPAGSGKNTTSTTPVCTGTGTASCPGLTYPAYVALDYADNVYVLNWSGSTPTYTNVIGFGFDGTPLFSSPEDTTALLIKSISTDTAGHVIAANNDVSGATDLVRVYSATSGATLATITTGLGTLPQSTLADPLNNLYIASSNGGTNLRKATYGGTSTAPTYTVAAVTTTAPASGVLQISFDARQDLYFMTSTPNAYILPNTATVVAGTPSAPTYAAAGLVAVNGTPTGTASNSYGIASNNAGGAYVLTSAGITPITKSGTGSTTTIASGTPIALPNVTGANFDRYAAADGLSNLITVDGANGSAPSGVVFYDTADSLALGIYKGCLVNAASKACGTTTASTVPMYSPRSAAIDSAGDIWVVSGASSTLTELIGAAAPSWPGLSLAQTGRPQ